MDESLTDDFEAVHNTRKIYKNVFKQIKKGKFSYYGAEARAFYDALGKYDLTGKTALVWGLAGCNCEALALYYNAKKVYVVDYNKPVCDHEKIEVLTHDELAAFSIKTDFAFSYSSFEHDGLGRYGDPLCPSGDLNAMQDARKYLNDDGILFLGVPLGPDCLVWNDCRIYGKTRLPLLLKGWRCVDVFDVYDIHSEDYPFDNNLGDGKQNVLVLKKAEGQSPQAALLQEAAANEKYKTIRVDIANRINALCAENK
jgi:hypothetical protein